MDKKCKSRIIDWLLIAMIILPFVACMVLKILTKPLTEGDEGLIEFSKYTARRQNEGVFDLYINEGKKVAEKHGVQIADAYAKWKEMAANGIDTDKLLANGINHPTPEMHQLFADEIMKLIFSDNDEISTTVELGLDKK